MDTPRPHNMIERVADKEGAEEEREDDPPSPNHESLNIHTITSLPPSSSSSPSNDFSFTLSLHPSSTTRSPDKFKPSSSLAVDVSPADNVSPADDIFFHGHLLPLHLISSSNRNSLDNLNRPVRDLIGDHKVNKNYPNGCTSNKGGNSNTASGAKDGNRPKSFMIRLAKWRKAFESGERDEDVMKRKKKARWDVGGVLKRYMRLIQPLFSRTGEKERRVIGQPPNCHSGHMSSKLKESGGRRKGGLSAPASMWTSPTNSGLLVATSAITSSDSTMEELQNAIQAAIAHCKNSIAVKEDKCKC
ncbi:BRI1 kinase inhibitor 1-like protein [Cinnamomum micranthum f. kanehirae]|uniref:BRI1 kinase inhibitor 1-like protein n=1 Tax=Cinnamomum micranthum f. kanehirae TaxID=337451 RepID=A0A3S3QES4_9MAGN|nr:BRI1 kinase inhibitor 1-like protein [Cinnamomum micranthum f. kanehirae]